MALEQTLTTDAIKKYYQSESAKIYSLVSLLIKICISLYPLMAVDENEGC